MRQSWSFREIDARKKATNGQNRSSNKQSRVSCRNWNGFYGNKVDCEDIENCRDQKRNCLDKSQMVDLDWSSLAQDSSSLDQQ